MKIIKPAVELIKRDIGPLKLVELAGRTCYKSMDHLTENSAINFCENMKKSGHHAMLEHGVVHLLVRLDFMDNEMLDELLTAGAEDGTFKYIFLTRIDKENEDSQLLVTASFRAFIDYFNNTDYGLDVLQKALKSKLAELYPVLFENIGTFHSTDSVVEISDEEVIKLLTGLYIKPEYDKREIMRHIHHTLVFTTDRGVTHEFVRHRPCSFGQESTRYCNYSKDKFGNEITVVEPCDLKDDPIAMEVWKASCETAEKSYFKILELGYKPQNARGVLPTDLKTEIVITTNEIEWQHMVNLRKHGTTGAPHPHMQDLMNMAYPIIVEESSSRVV